MGLKVVAELFVWGCSEEQSGYWLLLPDQGCHMWLDPIVVVLCCVAAAAVVVVVLYNEADPGAEASTGGTEHQHQPPQLQFAGARMCVESVVLCLVDASVFWEPGGLMWLMLCWQVCSIGDML
jgi:hypothetical protein